MVESSNKKYSVVDAIKIVIYNWNRASIMQGAAEMAYYMLLSLVPILLVVANVIPLLPFDTAEILNLLEQTFPEDINQIIMPIVLDYLKSGSGGAISIGLLASIWSASKVFTTLRRVLDEVYGTTEAKNFIVARLLSLLSMIAILGVVAAAVFAFVFGEQILGFIKEFLQIEFPLIQQLLQIRWIGLPLILFAFGLIIYDVVPNHHLKWHQAIPGAVFFTVGITLIFQSFSIITRFMGGDAIANQTIGGFIALMLFLYFANVVILFGALLNTLLFEIKNDQSVLDYESELAEKEKLEDSDWQGYPDEDKVVLLKRKLYKVSE